MENTTGLMKYGNRLDNTPKGSGFFGELPMQDGSNDIATELSTSFNYGNGDILVPLLNPYLSENEITHLLQGKEPTEDIINKTSKWGFDRINQNRSPFFDKEDGNYGLLKYRGK